MIVDANLSRRGFARSCGIFCAIVACGTTLGCARQAEADDTAVAGEGVSLPQYGFLVDMGKCVGCENCVAACRQYNKLSNDTPNRRTITVFQDSRDENVYVSTSCMHCDEPNCMRVCPAGAITKGEAGIVHVDKQKCIGCKYCYQACPYGVPNYNSEAMDKCDCCLDAGIAPGETPYCVQACIFNALKYGPVDELVAQAEGRGLEPVPVGEPCGPNCYLVGEVA